MITATGFDLGNTRTKICIQNKCISIPSGYAFDEPIIIGKSGTENKPRSFRLLFNNNDFFFGQDILASERRIQKLNASKYETGYISMMFRAALYQWSNRYKIDISSLGKLNIVASMPPGLFQKNTLNTQAVKAYESAFNRGQSHVKVRDGKRSVQIVTHFQSLVREAIVWGRDIPRKDEYVGVFDLGGETNDIAVFNGRSEPVFVKTLHTGLLHTYAKINSSSPESVELEVLTNKASLSPELLRELAVHYNRIENSIHLVNGYLPRPIDRLYLIGGGTVLMPKTIRETFRVLASKVIFKNEFANVVANWKEASK